VKLTSQLLLAIAKQLPRGYWKIIKYAAAKDPCLQDLQIPLNGISNRLRADLRESVFIPLWRTGHIPHQTGFDQVCRRLLRPGDIVFDVGANVGYTTALYADLVGSCGRVYGVEPSPRAFGLLHRSLGNVANVTLLCTGVSAAEGKLAFYVPTTLDTASVVPIEGADRISIDVTTLDGLSSHHHQPSLVKVDVEGFESEVFKGAVQTLGHTAPPIIIFEALGNAALQQSVDILSKLSHQQYRFARLRNDGTLGGVVEAGSSDYLALPKWAEARLIEAE